MDTANSFFRFLREKEQRRELCILAGLFLLSGILLHVLYPYPFVFSDSGAYLLGASQDYFNIYRPSGYSRYLQLLHGISPKIGFVFFTTYALTSIGILLLLFSVKYLFGIRNKAIFYPLCLLAWLSPRIFFSCNFLMSDGLFHFLTVYFLLTALWLVFSKNKLFIPLHLLTFMLLYQVRYSGMFYLPVSILALALSPAFLQRSQRMLFACLPLLLFYTQHTHNKSEYRKHTGFDISSGFSGWQLINNAAVLFPEAKQLPATAFDTPNQKTLHAFLQNMPDSLFSPQHSMSTSYMWSKELPFKLFLNYILQTTRTDYQSAWVYAGSLYQEYASRLIREYPWQYFTKFIVPSFASTFKFQPIYEENAPFALDAYSAPYYHLGTTPLEHRHRIFQALNPVRKVFNALYWTALCATILYYLAFGIRKRYFKIPSWQAHFLVTVFILVYTGVSCLASPNTTWRYSMPIFIPSLIFMACIANSFIERRKIHGK